MCMHLSAPPQVCIQAADARYHPPAIYDVIEQPGTPWAAAPTGVNVNETSADGPADGQPGEQFDVAAGWLTPRLASARSSRSDGSGSSATLIRCAAALPGQIRKAALPGGGRRGLPSRLPGASRDLADARERSGAIHSGAIHSGAIHSGAAPTDATGGTPSEALHIHTDATGGTPSEAGGATAIRLDDKARQQRDAELAALHSHTDAELAALHSHTDAELAACATGTTWARMARPMLARHVLAIGERLGLTEGMSVLDVGSTCGHALTILQERYRHKLRAVGVDGSRASIRYAKRTSRGSFCVGDVRRLGGIADDTMDAAFTMGTYSLFTRETDVCAAARELGRVIRPGGRAMIVSVPKPDCAVTQDAEWDCPQCYWTLRGIDKGFWQRCLQLQPSSAASGGGGAYRVELVSNTALFPFKPASYCHREHYTVVIHKKSPASVHIFSQPKAKTSLAVLTVASTPPIGEYGKQKVHYLTELSIENKRQYCAQHAFELVVAQNLAHGRTARWDKVMLLRRMLTVTLT